MHRIDLVCWPYVNVCMESLLMIRISAEGRTRNVVIMRSMLKLFNVRTFVTVTAGPNTPSVQVTLVKMSGVRLLARDQGGVL